MLHQLIWPGQAQQCLLSLKSKAHGVVAGVERHDERVLQAVAGRQNIIQRWGEWVGREEFGRAKHNQAQSSWSGGVAGYFHKH